MAPYIELLSRGDERYGRFVAGSMRFDADQDRGRAKDPWGGAHHENLRALEIATMKWLSKFDRILTDLVLASPGETTPWGGHRFYELDFVGGTLESPIFFGEFKHSNSASAALRAARKQLRKRMTLGASRWPGVAGIAICFKTAWEREAKGGEAGACSGIDELGEMLKARLNPNDIKSIVVDGSELISRLEIEGLLASSFEAQISESYRLMKSPTSILEASSQVFSLASAFDRLDTSVGPSD